MLCALRPRSVLTRLDSLTRLALRDSAAATIARSGAPIASARPTAPLSKNWVLNTLPHFNIGSRLGVGTVALRDHRRRSGWGLKPLLRRRRLTVGILQPGKGWSRLSGTRRLDLKSLSLSAKHSTSGLPKNWVGQGRGRASAFGGLAGRVSSTAS